jgi:hypothetical protein
VSVQRSYAAFFLSTPGCPAPSNSNSPANIALYDKRGVQCQSRNNSQLVGQDFGSFMMYTINANTVNARFFNSTGSCFRIYFYTF